MSDLRRIPINVEEKELLEKLAGLQIYVRNSFDQNQKEIGDLLEQAKQNAYIYLQRNQLGQKLSMFEENNLFTSLIELQKILNLNQIPRRIECYDISHLSGKFVYGSMVVFIDGRPAKKFYRLFKTKEQNNDFANHQEVLRRRFKRALDWEIEKNGQLINENSYQNNTSSQINPWQLPDLIIVDGGKGQLSGDLEVLMEFKEEYKNNKLPFEVEICSLAKKEEEIFLPNNNYPISNTNIKLGSEGGILLEKQTKFLIQRIRDEAHRFAITNNRNARLKTASKSQLDEIAGIGPKTKQKLLATFSSTEQVVENLYKRPELVYELVGKKITEKLKSYFGVSN